MKENGEKTYSVVMDTSTTQKRQHRGEVGLTSSILTKTWESVGVSMREISWTTRKVEKGCCIFDQEKSSGGDFVTM